MNTSLIIIIVGILFYLMTCLALINIGKKDFGATYKKVIWGFIVLIPFLGCLLYFILGSRKGVKS